jgi:hypothetical protein
LPGKGLLCGKKIPDTVLFGAQVGEFGTEGLKMAPVEPMKKWTISYKGQMWWEISSHSIKHSRFCPCLHHHLISPLQSTAGLASAIARHLAISSATRIQLPPAVLRKSSLHLAWGGPTIHSPRRGLHSTTRLPQRLSVLRLIWPAHCHFSMLIRCDLSVTLDLCLPCPCLGSLKLPIVTHRLQNDPEKIVEVDFQGDWISTSNYFDYDSDLYPPAVIRSVAREKWSKAYFNNLKT